MPTISPSSAVLVTGANGFIGLWTVYELLLRGYSVHAAVRSQDKVQALSHIVALRLPHAAARFSGFVVPDIALEGAFDRAIEGVEGVVHIASPMCPPSEDPQAYIQPAVRGTLGILNSALRSNAKRVVITGSVVASASCRDTLAPARVYTEDDWNDAAVEHVVQEGVSAPDSLKYDASKTMAERAAWEFMEQHSSDAHFDLTFINPSWVFGPVLDVALSSPSALPPTPGLMYAMLFASPAPPMHVPDWLNFIDVRDVAEIHIRALELEEAGGQRIIANSQLTRWDDWLSAAARHGILTGRGHVKVKNASRRYTRENPPAPYFANAKARRIFGFKLRTAPDTLRDVVYDLASRGWLTYRGVQAHL